MAIKSVPAKTSPAKAMGNFQAPVATEGPNESLGLPDTPAKSISGKPPTGSEASINTTNIRGKTITKSLDRHVTTYRIYASEIRALGAAQAMTAIFASIGAFQYSVYIERGNDILMSQKALSAETLDALQTVKSQAGYLTIIFFALALLLLIIQGLDLSRIKSEHLEPTIWGLVSKKWKSFLTYWGA